MSEDDKALVERLKDQNRANQTYMNLTDRAEAADRITQLSAEVERLTGERQRGAEERQAVIVAEMAALRERVAARLRAWEGSPRGDAFCVVLSEIEVTMAAFVANAHMEKRDG